MDFELNSRLEYLIENDSLVGEKFHAYDNEDNKIEWTIVDISEIMSIESKSPIFSINAIDLKQSMTSTEMRKYVLNLLKDKSLFLRYMNENKLPLWSLVYDNSTLSFVFSNKFKAKQKKEELSNYSQTMQDIINSKSFLFELELDKILLKHLGMPYYNFIKEKYLTYLTKPTKKNSNPKELTEQQKTDFDKQFHDYFKKELACYYQTSEGEME